MANNLDISILIATYNRAEILRETLESMTRLERSGLKVEFVVVDNNSSDNTKQVVERFSSRLPIRYLFEPRPGKNCALNKALAEVKLGEIVVFADDDVEPQRDWLKTIVSICERWPDYNVFGGKVYPVWPKQKVPKWAKNPKIEGFAFAVHDYANSECCYQHRDHPVGPNFWVLRKVFSNGRCFDETVGPRPTNRIMGSESTFLKQLRDDGYSFLYSPKAVVGHRISYKQLSFKDLIKRAYRWGRGSAHTQSLCRQSLFNKSRFFWYLVRSAAIIRLMFLLVLSLVPLIVKRNPEKTVHATRGIGYNFETFKIGAMDKST